MKMADATHTTNELEDMKEFLRSAARVLRWKGLVDERILYTFCGKGHNYTQTILRLFPKIRKVFFTDILDATGGVNIGRKEELLAANIQDISKLPEYKEYFSHIVSIHCFNWLKDCKSGFRAIYYLLKCGGTAAILLNINSPFEDCLKNLVENSAWKYTDLCKESPFPKFPVRLSVEEYKEIIQDIGFNVVECEEYNRIYEFQSLLDFYNKCIDFITPLLAYIPKDQQKAFENDFLDNFKDLYGFSHRGKPRIKCKTLSIFIRKPAENTEAPSFSTSSSTSSTTISSTSSTTISSTSSTTTSSTSSTIFNSYNFSNFGRI